MIVSGQAKVIPSNYLTVEEAATEMNVSHTTIYRLIKEGGLKTLGGFRQVIARTSFDNHLRLVTTQCTKPAAKPCGYSCLGNLKRKW